MRLPSFTRIVREDLPSEVQSWIDKLINPLNSFMLTIRNGLNKGLTVNDNLGGAVKTVTVRGGAVEFAYSTSRPPKAVILGSWRNTTTSTWTPTSGVVDAVTVTSGITLSWYYTEGKISCTFYGLSSTDTYEVTLLILED